MRINLMLAFRELYVIGGYRWLSLIIFFEEPVRVHQSEFYCILQRLDNTEVPGKYCTFVFTQPATSKYNWFWVERAIEVVRWIKKSVYLFNEKSSEEDC